MSRADEVIGRLQAEIVKRDARIAELEAFADHANAQMLEAFAELEQQRGGVVLPERASDANVSELLKAIGWMSDEDSKADAITVFNYTLDEVARLNPPGECVSVLDWAVERWHAEVSQRPMVNVHRRSLDETWRQIIKRLGGDPVDLCGPDHVTLLDQHGKAVGDE